MSAFLNKEKNMEPQIRILKFGSSVLRSEADLPTAVQEIYREWRRGAAVVAVVPAFGDTTDDLLKRAEQLGLPPSPGAVAALLATGESAASALLTLALQRSGLPRRLLAAGPLALVEGEADVIVELLGGREPARRAVIRALKLGKSVVTANKALLAEEIDSLERLAARGGARLLYSASVGGALPALEAVRRSAGRIRAISGVLNGTCNYVLDRLAAGDSFETAVAAARAAGFAEADPALDLDGSDAAQKLSLLVREAFGVTPRWDTIPRLGIAGVDRAALESAVRQGRTVRLVASAERTSAGLRASVRPVEVPRSHPFAQTSGAGNALRIETTDGEVIDLSAQGAGRWPTCEAVLADLYDLAAARARGGGVVERERGIEGVRAQEGAA